MKREQKGTIILRSGKWYASYWEKRNINGAVERRRATHCLGEKTTRSKYPPEEIKDACKRHMATVNGSATKITDPKRLLSVVAFVDTVYMPRIEKFKRPATANGYKKIYQKHLRPHFGDILLRDYRRGHATAFLTQLAENGMGKNSLNHVRALMSGIFAWAVELEHVDANPIHDAKSLVDAAEPKETPHYTVQEMGTALSILGEEPQARLAMALSFIGLRPSEIRGLRWEDVDFDAGQLHVRRSAWRGIVNKGCKTKRSKRDVTIGSTVIQLLRDYQTKHPSQLGHVLENGAGRPLDLDALAQDVIRPMFKVSGLNWKGYYAGRRGAVTEMGRHTNGNTQTMSAYFGHSPEVEAKDYLKALPDVTRIAGLDLDTAIGETYGRLETQRRLQ
jgi:integrase